MTVDMISNQSLSVPQEFIITILNDQTGYFHQVEGWNLNCAVIGAILADLSLKGRIDADDESLFLLDSTETNDPVLDTCLAEIALHPDREKPRYWIERLSVHAEDIIDTTLNHLVDVEVLVHHDGEFYTTNHCAWHAQLEQYPESETVGDYVRSRVQRTVLSEPIPDPRDSFLIGLLSACDVLGQMFDLDEEHEARIELICQLELINRLLSVAVKQVIVAPSLQHSPLTKPIPKVALKHLLSNRHLWDGNLPALFGNLADQYGPVFQIGVPLQKPRTFLAGSRINHWARRNSRRYLTSGHFFREMETICGANNLLPSMDGGEHFRLRKLMGRIYSKKRFIERLDDLVRLTRQFMVDQNWQAGSELKVQQDTRLMTNFQMFQIFLSIDAQDEFEELVKWNERAIMCYVARFLPRFMARTPAMNRRFRLYEDLVQRIDQSHIPIQRTCVVENHALPLRERVHIVQTAAHYMSDSFPDPYKFDIDRYLPPRNEHRGSGYAPYGSDTHLCAGQAWMRLHLAVTVLIWAYHFEFAPVAPDYRLKIDPFPALSVSQKLRLSIAGQWRDLSS